MDSLNIEKICYVRHFSNAETEGFKKVFAAKVPTFIFAVPFKAVENRCDEGASDFQGPDRTT